MHFDPSRRSFLTRHDLDRFPSESLFDRVGRVLCEAECLPRELYQSWEVARRVRRRVRGRRVVDLACGHGLVAHLALLLDDRSPTALATDVRLPPSAFGVREAMARAWPRLEGRVELAPRAIDEVAIGEGDLVISAHACGGLTDAVIARAIAARAPVAVLPCCHDVERSDTGGLEGWLDASLAIDVTRAARLSAAGYDVRTQTLPATITAKNRLLLAIPRGGSARDDRPR